MYESILQGGDLNDLWIVLLIQIPLLPEIQLRNIVECGSTRDAYINEYH